MQSIYLAAGCFWCSESVFLKVKGVKEVIPGYIGGSTKNPTYEEICKGTTGHAEAIECKFSPNIVSLETILDIFFLIHDPTQFNRQGNDIGTQYRSAIFYSDEKYLEIIKSSLNKAQANFEKKIVTELSNKTNFTKAEEYHHNYFNKNPGSYYCNALIPDKIKKFKKNYPEFFKY